MEATVTDLPEVRRARVAVAAAFASSGGLFGVRASRVPAISRAAADPRLPADKAVASVATLACGGMPLGPPVIGGVAELVGLRGAFMLLAALAFMAFDLARHACVPGETSR